MARLQKDNVTRYREVRTAWAQLRPHKRFFGMSLGEFDERAKPYLEAREEIARLEKLLSLEFKKRDQAEIPLMDLVQSIVASVCGDPEEGHNGELYSAMGYVPKNRRAKGVVRRRRAKTVEEGGQGS